MKFFNEGYSLVNQIQTLHNRSISSKDNGSKSKILNKLVK